MSSEAHGSGPPRKRMRRIEVANQPRFVTFSTHLRAPFLADAIDRDRFVTELMRSRREDGFLLHAFVVMPEHVHLVLTPTRVELSKSLSNMKRRTAQYTLARWRQANLETTAVTAPDGGQRFWLRGGGYDRNIRDEGELVEKVIYTETNPVRRGLVSTPSEWGWSSAFVRAHHAPADWMIDRID